MGFDTFEESALDLYQVLLYMIRWIEFLHLSYLPWQKLYDSTFQRIN